MSKETSKRFHLRASNMTALPLTRSPAIRELLEKKQKEDTRGSIVLTQEERDNLIGSLIEEKAIRIQCDPRPKPEEMTTYPAFGNRWYEGVRIKTIEERALAKKESEMKAEDRESDTPKVLFADAEFNLYDQNYMKVSNSSLLEKLKSKRFKEVPDSKNYENYYEFERALLEWHTDCATLLENIRLPHVIGRSYYRPKLAMKHDVEGKASNVNFVSVSLGGGERDLAENADDVEQDYEDLDEDPWDTTLYPEEPNPYLYKTEEEYDEAMCRWAVVCSKLPSLPPHPSQFEDLLKLSIAKATKETGRKDDAQKIREKQEIELLSRTKILYWYNFSQKFLRYNRIPIIDKLNPPTSPYDERLVEAIRDVQCELVEVFNRGDEDEDDEVMVDDSVEDKLLFKMIRMLNSYANTPLPLSTKLSVSLKKILDLQEYKLQKYGSYQKQLLPIIHGTLPKGMPDNSRDSFGMAKSRSRMVKAISEPLRREDLSGPVRASCRDSPGQCNGVDVEFFPPRFWPGELKFEKLQDELEEKEYDPLRFKRISVLEEEKKRVSVIDGSGRLDFLNSWYYPKRPKQYIDRSIEHMMNTLAKEDMGIEDACRLLMSDMYLDVFQNQLALVSDDIDNEQQVSNISIILKVIDENNFRMVTELFDRTKSVGSLKRNAKVAHFVTETLQQSAHAKEIIQSTVENEDIEVLYWIAFAITFFGDAEYDLFQFQMDVMSLSCQVYGESFECIVKNILIHYYLSVISESISAQTFLYVSINNMVLELIKVYGEMIGALIQDDPLFVTQALLGVRHNTSAISHFNLFLISRLMVGINSDSLLETLKGESVDLLRNIHDLLSSKFSHTKYACRVLFKYLRSPKMIEFAFNSYLKESFFLDALKDDGLGKPSSQMTFMQENVIGLLTSYFRMLTVEKKMNIMSLLESDAFHKTLDILKRKTGSKQNIGGSAVACSVFLAEYTRMLHRLELITGKEAVGDEAKYTLSINVDDIDTLFSIIYNYHEKVYSVRTPLVVCLRHILKPEKVFDMIRGRMQYYEKILGFCKGSKDNVEFSRECWRLFYQSIRYHVGVLDLLLKQNLLGQFLEAVNPSIGNIIMMNGLHYIGKLFNMAQNELKRQINGKKVAREDIKTMDKEVKNLIDFFIRKHRFISLHMIYKRFTAAQNEGSLQVQFPGAPFLSLVTLYNHLANSPSCAKLLKDAKKNAEYGAGLSQILEMTQMPADAGEFHNISGISDRFKKQELRKSYSRLSFSSK